MLWGLGYPDQALKKAYEAMALFDAQSDPFSLAMAMMTAAQIHCARRESAKGEELARALLALCDEHGYPFWLLVGKRVLAWALIQQERAKEGIEMIAPQLQRLAGAEAEMARYNVLLNLAEAHGKIGASERGLATLDEWLAARRKLSIAVNDSYFYRLRGQLLLHSGADEEAEKSLRQSIDVAVLRSAKIHELRAAMSLARLLLARGRRDEARAMLAEIYAWFTEGFDTPDLKDATAWLDETSG